MFILYFDILQRYSRHMSITLSNIKSNNIFKDDMTLHTIFILDSCKHYAVLENNAAVGAAHVLTSATVPRASLCAKLCNEHGACYAFSVLQSSGKFECTLGKSTSSLVYQNGSVLYHLP